MCGLCRSLHGMDIEDECPVCGVFEPGQVFVWLDGTGCQMCAPRDGDQVVDDQADVDQAEDKPRPRLCAHADLDGQGMHWLEPGETCTYVAPDRLSDRPGTPGS